MDLNRAWSWGMWWGRSEHRSAAGSHDRGHKAKAVTECCIQRADESCRAHMS
jgi:hypothetical protein